MSIAHAFAVVLMTAGGQGRGPALGADLVDAGQAVQEPAQRRVVAGHAGEIGRQSEAGRTACRRQLEPRCRQSPRD